MRETQKIIQSLELHISHQMMPCSNAKSIWRLSLTCFKVSWALGHLGKLSPNRAQIPQIMTREAQQIINSLQLIISHQVSPYLSLMTIRVLSLTCSRAFGPLVQFVENGPQRALNTGNHWKRDTGSHWKSSTHHFRSSEVLLKCSDHLRVEFNLF